MKARKLIEFEIAAYGQRLTNVNKVTLEPGRKDELIEQYNNALELLNGDLRRIDDHQDEFDEKESKRIKESKTTPK